MNLSCPCQARHPMPRDMPSVLQGLYGSMGPAWLTLLGKGKRGKVCWYRYAMLRIPEGLWTCPFPDRTGGPFWMWLHRGATFPSPVLYPTHGPALVQALLRFVRINHSAFVLARRNEGNRT